MAIIRRDHRQCLKQGVQQIGTDTPQRRGDIDFDKRFGFEALRGGIGIGFFDIHDFLLIQGTAGLGGSLKGERL